MGGDGEQEIDLFGGEGAFFAVGDAVGADGTAVVEHGDDDGAFQAGEFGAGADIAGDIGLDVTGGDGDATFGGVLGTAITRFKDLEIACTGLTERAAAAAGRTAFGVITEASSRAHYYPGARPMKIKLVVERGTGRLLGGQIVGHAESGKRIDVLATALWNGMTVGDLAGMDLAYAPPFSPVWDPVLLAAGRAAALV